MQTNLHDRKHISGCLERLQKGHEKPLETMAMFTILTVVMASYITTCQIARFKYVQFTVPVSVRMIK